MKDLRRKYPRLLVAVATLALLFTAATVSDVNGATTSSSKTYWHKVGNDRFRVYDVGGRHTPVRISFPWPIGNVELPFDSAGDASPPIGPTCLELGVGYDSGRACLPGVPPYAKFINDPAVGSPREYWKWARRENRDYAKIVDWPVNFIFRNNASIKRVKAGLERQGLDYPGGPMFLTLSDSVDQGNPWHVWWDTDRGLKEHICSGLPIAGSPRETNHIRLYADSQGETPGTRDNRMYNPWWGFYVLGTSHVDHLECPPTDATWFGRSELAEARIGWLAEKEWGESRVSYTSHWLNNKEGIFQPVKEGNHIWHNDGFATVVKVGLRATASSDPEEEPEPPVEEPLPPAVGSDVDGDGQGDLVTLHTNGAVHTVLGSDGSIHASLGGTMDQALFDGVGVNVVDVGDVNGDRRSDLVTLNSSGTVYNYLGQADGSFGNGVNAGSLSPGVHASTGHEPIGVGDVTGDSRDDLVTFDTSSGSLYVYPGTASGAFGSGLTRGGQLNSALFDREGIYFVDVADVSGDGFADVVGLTSYLGSSYGAAVTYTGSALGLSPWGTQIEPTVDAVMNDGTGNEPLGVGDVNGDEHADLVTLNPAGSISVYAGMRTLHEPTQTYRLLAETPVTSLAGQSSSLITGSGDDLVGLLDRTGDGLVDLVKVTSNGTVFIAPGQESLEFGAFERWASGVPSNRFRVAPGHEMVLEKPVVRRAGCTLKGCFWPRPLPDSDVNGDGRSDLVTLGTNGTAYTYLSVGAMGSPAQSFYGTMQSALFHGEGHHVIDVARVNSDLYADMITMTGDGLVHTYWGQSGGGFSGGAEGSGALSFGGAFTSGIFDADVGYEPIAVGDVTGDGLGDLVAYHAPSKNLYVFLGQANGTFSSSGIAAAPGNRVSDLHKECCQRYFDVVDVNGDGFGDLVGMDLGQPSASVSLGSASGQIGERIGGTGLGNDVEFIGAADVNGDHRADFVTLENGEVKVYEGYSQPKFAKSSTLPAVGIFATSPSGVSFSELDSSLRDGAGLEFVGVMDETGDGRADLIAVEPDGTALRFAGRTDFTFGSPSERELSGYAPRRFARPGHEIVVEKPFWRRAGCYRTYCAWPPPTVDSDLDVDGRADLITLRADGTVQASFGKPDRTFTTPSTVYAGTIDPAQYDYQGEHVVDVADVTGDRRADFITVRSSGAARVYPGRASNDFGSPIESLSGSIPAGANTKNGFEPIGVADVTDDGLADLVAFDPQDSRFHTYPGQSSGAFGAGITTVNWTTDSAMFDGTGGYFLALDNLVGTSNADILYVDKSGWVWVIEGHTSGTFDGGEFSFWGENSLIQIMADRNGHEPVGLADLNGDGYEEMVTQHAGAIQVYATNEIEEFTTPVESLAGVVPSNLLADGSHELVGALDVDGNGRDDLIAANAVGGVDVYGGESDYTFADDAAVSLPGFRTTRHRETAPTHHEIAIETPVFRRRGCEKPICPIKGSEADLDGDDRGDLIAVDADGTAHVYRGTATGIEASASTASLTEALDPALHDGVGHYAIDTADVTGDGRTDLVTMKSSGGLYVHPGKATATFGAGIESRSGDKPIMANTSGKEPIAVADVNGDGRADLLQESGWFVSTHLGNADGTFGAATGGAYMESALLDKSGHYFLDAADVTGDKRADLVSMNTNGTVYLAKGEASGALATPAAAATINPIMDNGVGQEPVGLGDVNGDGRVDLVTLDGTTLKLWAGQAGGTFAAATTAYATAIDSSLTDGTGQELVALLDYNRDDRADLVSVRDDGDVLAYAAQSNGTFAAPVVHAGSIDSSRLNIGGQQMASEKPFLRRLECSSSGCPSPRAVAPTDNDSNGDDRGDLIAVTSDGTARVYRGTATGIEAGAFTASLSEALDPALHDGVGHYVIDTADVTGEGRADLVTMKSSGGVFVHPGRAGRGFGTGIESRSGDKPIMANTSGYEPIAVADVNGDGRADLLQELGWVVSTHLGNADGTFGAGVGGVGMNSALLDKSGHYFLDAADVTGDKRADLVSMHTNGTVYLAKGEASGALATPAGAATINPIMDDGSGQEPVGLGDVNGDGKADLLTLDGTTLKLWAGKSDGTFAAATTPYATAVNSNLTDGTGQELVALLDYNRDDLADLISVRKDGDVLANAAQPGGTFAAHVVHAGSIESSRLDVGGEQMASEKPIVRRLACTSTGCPDPRPVAPTDNDSNGDDRGDLITVTSDGTARVYRGTATGIEAGAFTASLSEALDPALHDGVGHYAIDTADVTGEGRADLVTMKSSGGVFVHPGRAGRGFGTGIESRSGDTPVMRKGGNYEPIAVADVNGDGRGDLLQEFGWFVATHLGNADGTFGAATGGVGMNSALLDKSGHYFLDAADVTGDKRADLVSMNTNGTVYLAKGEASGALATPAAAATINPIMDDGSGQEPVGLGDVNGDGRADLVTLDGTTLKLWAGQAGGTFAAATTAYATAIDSSLTDGTGQELVALLDYNRDDRADLVSVRDDGDVLAYAAQSNGTFAAPVVHAGSIESSRLSSAGQQMASEKPILRRLACTSTGCPDPRP